MCGSSVVRVMATLSILALGLLASGCSSMTAQERRAALEGEREHWLIRNERNDLRSNLGRAYSDECLPPIVDPRNW